MNDHNNPCYKCTYRHPNCHGKCEAHKEWLDYIHEMRDAKRREDFKRHCNFSDDRKRLAETYSHKMHRL